MIQEIEPHQFHNQFLQDRTCPAAGDYVAYKKQGKIALLSWQPGIDTGRFLFGIDEKAVFEGPGTCGEDLYLSLSEIRKTQPRVSAYLAVTAYSLLDWYESRTFCGRCGAPMQDAETERARVCPVCHLTEYPKICPVVIVGVIRGNKILLTRYANNMRADHYALVAGFAEIGETIEDTVKREVLEETGLHVDNLHYFKSQPWGFSSSLLLGFFCEAKEGETVSLDDHELGLAVWTDREDAPEDAAGIALTAHMIEAFRRNGRKVLGE